MTTIRSISAATALLVATALPLSAQTGLTIYNSGRVMVRRTLPIAIPKGASEQRVTLGTLDPSTMFPLDPAVSLLGATYDGGTDGASILRRAVGREILFMRGTGTGDTVRTTLLAVDPDRYRYADGTIGFQMPGVPRFPADVVIVEPTLKLSLTSAKALPSLGLAYFTSGAGWQASYQVILGGKDARVAGNAVIESSTINVADAELQLMAGDVGSAPQARRAPAMAAMSYEGAAAKDEQVGEAHLYTVPGRVTIRPGETSLVALFDPTTAPVVKRLVVQSGLPYWGGLPQYGDEQQVPVAVTYVVTRALKTPFGDTPVPGGVARIYQKDNGGRLQLIGESSLGHTAAGQPLELDAGTAFDFTAKRTQTTYAITRDKNGKSTATADYRVTVANATDSSATVDVYEERGGDWAVVTSSVPADRVSSTRVRFKVAVPAKGETTITYQIRASW
ncbi:MAG: hypothetical protein R2910_01000 [Gemmatimonadales bacterium]